MGKQYINYILTLFLMAILLLSLQSCGEFQSFLNQNRHSKLATQTAKDSTARVEHRKFLVKAAEINLDAIWIGQLAYQRSSNPRIKSLGNAAETEHSLIWHQLSDLATKKMVEIPSSPTESGEDAYVTLFTKSGVAFDIKYCEIMAENHEAAIAIYEHALRSSIDMDVKIWAKGSIVDLKKKMNESLGVHSELSMAKNTALLQ